MKICKLCLDEIAHDGDFCDDCQAVIEMEGLGVEDVIAFDHDGYQNHGDRDMDSFFYDGWD